MNYLARLFLDYPTSALQSIDDAYDWHQRAWETLAHSAQGDQRGDGQFRPFLTRLDPQEGGYQLLILSRTEPRRPSWCPDHPANWQTKMVAESLLEHRRYRFDLRANPTRKVTPKGENGKREGQGKRVALLTLSQLEEWMERKASAAGFALEPGSLQISARGPTHFRKQKWRPPGTLSIVDFGGTLRVVDRRAFQAAFANGIGSAKAFGCGLLMLQSLD